MRLLDDVNNKPPRVGRRQSVNTKSLCADPYQVRNFGQYWLISLITFLKWAKVKYTLITVPISVIQTRIECQLFQCVIVKVFIRRKLSMDTILQKKTKLIDTLQYCASEMWLYHLISSFVYRKHIPVISGLGEHSARGILTRGLWCINQRRWLKVNNYLTCE